MRLKQDNKIREEQLQGLNKLFKPLSAVARIALVYDYFEVDSVLMTSSFGTKSALLLYWISNIKAEQTIHFLDTGYHFEETLTYKEKLTEAFNLKVIDILPNEKFHQQSLESELWKSNASKCCYINKVMPLEGIKLDFKLWVSGLMAFQSPFRKNADLFEQKDNIIKFYPLIDLTEELFKEQYDQAKLPFHPLQVLGYQSIGCLQCTQQGKGRSGRWAGSTKTECGLHFN